MSHKCQEPGCAFYLPDEYPLPLCPWHFAPDSDWKTKLLYATAALALFAGGYGVSKGVEAWKQLRARKAVSEGQEQWRQIKRQVAERARTEQTDSSSSHTDVA